MATIDSTRYYIVRGAGVVRAELERDHAGRILLNVAPRNWPFPRWRWCERCELVFAGGPPEPAAAPEPDAIPAGGDPQPAPLAEQVALELF